MANCTVSTALIVVTLAPRILTLTIGKHLLTAGLVAYVLLARLPISPTKHHETVIYVVDVSVTWDSEWGSVFDEWRFYLETSDNHLCQIFWGYMFLTPSNMVLGAMLQILLVFDILGGNINSDMQNIVQFILPSILKQEGEIFYQQYTVCPCYSTCAARYVSYWICINDAQFI